MFEAASRAPWITSAAVLSPMSAVVLNSPALATASDWNESKPASRSFSAVAGPTPGNSSRSTFADIDSTFFGLRYKVS